MRILVIFMLLQAAGAWLEPAPVFDDQPPAKSAAGG